MSRVALIDSDELSWKIALFYQENYYYVYQGDKFKWKTRYKNQAIESVGNRDDLEIVPKIEARDCKGFESKLDDITTKILSNTNSTKFKYFLSGENNFRYNLATLQPYKGNRTGEKPVHLETVKSEYLNREAQRVDFLEADDLLVYNYLNSKDSSIICSSDKDLKTVPSLNYSPSTEQIVEVDEDLARHNFYYQLLIGDSVDNIPSPYRLGSAKAMSFLSSLYGKSDIEYINKIIPFYSGFLNYKKDGSYKTKWYKGPEEHPIEKVLWEIGNLLYMHRTLDPEERWELPYG